MKKRQTRQPYFMEEIGLKTLISERMVTFSLSSIKEKVINFNILKNGMHFTIIKSV